MPTGPQWSPLPHAMEPAPPQAAGAAAPAPAPTGGAAAEPARAAAAAPVVPVPARTGATSAALVPARSGVPGGPFGIVRPHLGEALMALVLTQALWVALAAAVGAALALAAPALGDALERGRSPRDVAETSIQLAVLVAGPVWLGMALRAF